MTHHFDDLFHRFYDDTDVDDDSNINLNDPSIKNPQDDDVIDDNNFVINLTKNEEEQLSQKLSQLSASTKNKTTIENKQEGESKLSAIVKKRPSFTPPTTPSAIQMQETTAKKLKKDENIKEQDLQRIPKYLTRSYKAFDEMLNPYIRQATTFLNLEYLREIAFIFHQIESIHLNQLLWKTYLSSGIGELNVKGDFFKTANLNQKIFLWPEEVTKNMIAHGYTTASDINNILDQQTYISYVHRVLETYEKQINYYETQLEQQKKYLETDLPSDIEKAMKQFVQEHGIAICKLPIDGLISTVEYDYKDRLIQLLFHQEQPNDYQKEFFEQLYRAKLEKENSKFEVAILKQRLTHNHLPNEFNSIPIPSPSALITIEDTNIRQCLQDRYEKIVQRTKSEIMLVYIAVAETKMNEYRKYHDILTNKMKDIQRTGPIHKQFNETMLNLLEERFKNMNQHFINLYRLKIRFFDKAPTILN